MSGNAYWVTDHLTLYCTLGRLAERKRGAVMLSRLAPTPRAVSNATVLRIVAIRAYAAKPAPAKVQFQAPKGEKGVLKYERLYSRDGRYNPQPGHEWDTPSRWAFLYFPSHGIKTYLIMIDSPFFRFFVQTLKKNWELYPLYFFIGVWFVGFCYVIVWSFGKLELWIDRSTFQFTFKWKFDTITVCCGNTIFGLNLLLFWIICINHKCKSKRSDNSVTSFAWESILYNRHLNRYLKLSMKSV